MAREEAMTTPGYDYEQIPPGFYDEIHQRKAGVRYAWHDLKFRAVAARIGRPRRLLDVGCGPGTFIGNYLDGVDCLGVDFSAAQVGYAGRRYAGPRRRFSTATLAELAAAGERFEAITMIELIEHLAAADARRLLAAARPLLVADGVVVITTPNYRSLWPVIEWSVDRLSRVRYEQQHINKYRRARLAAELVQAGYRDVAVTTAVGLAPFAAVLGLRLVERLDAVGARYRHFGLGNLLLAVARP
ncbi:MAG: class I SAM-dependent methyltransferase [Alphaproteobacteria bacterium]|nr:class I SAM-dependent methyltransferase [Alphaproteobacteria bacterium]